MARPKMSDMTKKEKLNLTISPEVKEMLDTIRMKKNISISQFMEDCIRKEYQKISKGES